MPIDEANGAKPISDPDASSMGAPSGDQADAPDALAYDPGTLADDAVAAQRDDQADAPDAQLDDSPKPERSQAIVKMVNLASHNPDVDPPLWKPQPSEPTVWYARFKMYLLLGPSRSLYQAYKKNAGAESQQTGKPSKKNSGVPSSWRTQAIRWDWAGRARAWDEHWLQHDEAKWIRRHAQIRNAEWDNFGKLVEKAKQMLEYPLATTTREQTVGEDGKTVLVTNINPTRWAMSDAARLMKIASELGRLASGAETSRTTVTVSHKPLDEMTDDELAAIAARGFSASGTDSPETA